MKLLHIDSAITGDQSVSRKLSTEIVGVLKAFDPDLDLTYRDLVAEPAVAVRVRERRHRSEDADGDAAEAIGDAPISDSELAAPLPPLDNFDVEPVEFAEAADFHLSTLFALGFLLFVITFVVLALAKVMILRAEKAKGL